MRFERDGITWWYGTPDAPAPRDVVLSGSEVRIRIGAQTSAGSGEVDVAVVYRVNGGRANTLSAQPISGRSGRYFEVCLGAFWPGDIVEYTITPRRKGNRPTQHEKTPPFASSFRVEAQHTLATDPRGEGSPASFRDRAPGSFGGGSTMPHAADPIAGTMASHERRGGFGEPQARTVDAARLIAALSSCAAEGVRRAYDIQLRYTRQFFEDVFGSSEVARAWDRPPAARERRLRNYFTELMLVAPLAAERLATELTPDLVPGPTTATVDDRTVPLPMHVRDASQGLALYSIPLSEAQAALDAQHAPFRAFAASPERTLLALFVVDYRDSDLGQYFELGAALGVTPADDPHAALGMFILALPVNQRFSRDAGRQIWGYPKVLAPGLTISREGSSVRCTVVPDDPSTFALTLPRGGHRRASDVPIPRGPLHRGIGTSSEMAVVSYTLKEGRSQRVVVSRTGEGERLQVGGDVHLHLGNGDDNNCPCGLADRDAGAICLCHLLRRLNLEEKKPVACGWTERMSATLSAPRPLA